MMTMFESLLRFHFLSLLFLSCVSSSSSFTFTSFGLVACGPHQVQTFAQFLNEFDTRGCNFSDSFNGVWCDNSTGVITKLKLRFCLSGALKPNSSLFELHHLRYLDLDFNNIASSLPSEFGKLNKLEVLVLRANGIHGSIPSSFSNLSLLSTVDLDNNYITGSFPFPSVQNLTKLTQLDLSYNHFSGTIPPSLLTMPYLSYLSLSQNNFTGPIEVPNSSSSYQLDHLFLSYTHFEGKILEPISKLINLKWLEISSLNTNYPLDLSLLSSLKSLMVLKLSGNNISPASLSLDSYIPLTLEALEMSNCGIKEFPTILKTLSNLEILALSNNRINGKVPMWLWSLPRLTTMSLSRNSLNGFEGSMEDLVSSSVQVLDFESNSLEGVLPHLPLSIKVFSARNNSLRGDIPLSICNRSLLAGLHLSYNNFTGPIPQCLSNFKFLNLRKNNLERSIPDKFFAHAPLETFDVGYNRITGKLPRSLLNCSSLKFLSVDNNKIEDTFPFSLKALPNLRVLILSSNQFYGPISPPHQDPLRFPELHIFEISNNKFTGSLPPRYFVGWKASSYKMNEDSSLYMMYNGNSIGLPSLTYSASIDMQYKGLSMEHTKVLTSYVTIDFSGNRLEGQIPESVGLLKALIAINLSNNAFTGPIPPSLANLIELESLDLSRNQLSGTIPDGLGSLSFLAYINVSHNQLKGEIPQGTQITGQPRSSFEGNTELCGLPLEETCFETNAPPTQQPKEEDNEDEEQMLNWKAVAIGYGPGVLLGLVIAQFIALYKPEWLVKILGPL